MRLRIYACTHQAFQAPPDPCYVPLLCGAALPGREDPGYLRDDTGDQISLKNPYYSELTGLWWIWKNDHQSEALGLCHYRRYLLDPSGKLFTERSVTEALAEYDAITTKQIVLDTPYRAAFGGKHHPRDFALLEEAVAALEPEYLEDFRKTADGRVTYFGNLLIAGRSVFTEYAAWLFHLLGEVERGVDMTGYNDYQKRLYGFLSELLLMVWLRHQRLCVLECGVAVMGGKKETREAIARIAAYFSQGDTEGAARYYMELYQRRPDILMEASDVDGRLRLLAQMIATFQAERERTGSDYLSQERELDRLFTLFEELNAAVRRGGECRTLLSETAVEVARRLAGVGEKKGE